MLISEITYRRIKVVQVYSSTTNTSDDLEAFYISVQKSLQIMKEMRYNNNNG